MGQHKESGVGGASGGRGDDQEEHEYIVITTQRHVNAMRAGRGGATEVGRPRRRRVEIVGTRDCVRRNGRRIRQRSSRGAGGSS